MSLFLTLLLAGCTAQVTPSPTPIPSYVGTTPAHADWIETLVMDYWVASPGNGVVPLEYPLTGALEAAQAGDVGIVISSASPPPGWFSTPLQKDAIIVLVHSSVDVGDLDFDQLNGIFSGRLEDWEQLGGDAQLITPIVPLRGDELRSQFQAVVLQGSPFTTNALLAPNPEAALEYVSQRPGTIAFLPWTAIPTNRKPLSIEGILPTNANLEDGRYPLALQLQAFAPAEPSGSLRQFLSWLQEKIVNQATIQNAPE